MYVTTLRRPRATPEPTGKAVESGLTGPNTGFMTTWTAAQTIPSDQRSAAALAHLAAPIAMVVSAGWLSFLGPLLMWVVYKDRSPYVRSAAAQSFNFNLWAWVIGIVGWICFFTVILIPVALFLWAAAFILTVWCHLRATMAAMDGRQYEYRHQIRILS